MTKTKWNDNGYRRREKRKLHRAVDAGGRMHAYKYSVIGMQLVKGNEKK